MLTIERMYELAEKVACGVPPHPVCDRDDLVQCAVIGLVEAEVADEALATVIARRRIIDELRRHRGRSRGAGRPGRAAVHDATHLHRPFSGTTSMSLADVIPDDDDDIDQVESRLDATREAPALLRAAGRAGKHVLIWHVVYGRTMAEIAVRYGVSESRISQIASAAMARARTVHAARGCAVASVPARPRPTGGGRDWLIATRAEKRAFGEFRRMQRAGLSRQEALAALPEDDRLLVAEYQRKCQRRVRSRAAGGTVAKQPPRSQRRYNHVDDVVITAEERAAAGAVWSLTSRGLKWSEAIRQLPPAQRASAEAYNTKMRARSRVRARDLEAGGQALPA